MPRKISKPRHRRNRQYGSMKGTRLFKAHVPEEVFDFFEANALSDHGLIRSRGEILEVLVRSAKNNIRDRAGSDSSGVSHN